MTVTFSIICWHFWDDLFNKSGSQEFLSIVIPPLNWNLLQDPIITRNISINNIKLEYRSTDINTLCNSKCILGNSFEIVLEADDVVVYRYRNTRIYMMLLQQRDIISLMLSYYIHCVLSELRKKVHNNQTQGITLLPSPRFLCRLTAFIKLLQPFNVRG